MLTLVYTFHVGFAEFLTPRGETVNVLVTTKDIPLKAYAVCTPRVSGLDCGHTPIALNFASNARLEARENQSTIAPAIFGPTPSIC